MLAVDKKEEKVSHFAQWNIRHLGKSPYSLSCQETHDKIDTTLITVEYKAGTSSQLA